MPLNGATRISIKNLYAIANQFGERLEVLYEEYIVHGDLKPDNMMVSFKENDAVDQLSIIDFGLSVQATQIPKKENRWIIGTPGYISPSAYEQSKKNREYTLAAYLDMFSAGITLLELCVGREKLPSLVTTHDQNEYYRIDYLEDIHQLRQKNENEENKKLMDVIKKMIDITEQDKTAKYVEIYNTLKTLGN